MGSPTAGCDSVGFANTCTGVTGSDGAAGGPGNTMGLGCPSVAHHIGENIAVCFVVPGCLVVPLLKFFGLPGPGNAELICLVFRTQAEPRVLRSWNREFVV